MSKSNFVFDTSLLSLEYYFKEYYNKHKPYCKRIYLDITWSDLYVTEALKINPNVEEYQKILNTLDSTKKYFTLIEVEDGIINRYDHLDILIFGAGGAGDIPIPYMHRPLIKFDVPKKFLCSFMGSTATHPIREEIFKLFEKEKDFDIKPSISKDMYSYQMSSTIFSLCPRGRGPNSYRLFESLHMGVIPVYLSDEFWTPFDDEIDWEKLCVMVPFKKIDQIPDILRNITPKQIEDYQSYGQKIYNSFFLREKICDKIIKLVNK